MSSAGFNADSRDEALDVYAKLSSSDDPNNKLLALGGLVRFMQEADISFISRCAEVTDYVFLDKLIRNGTSPRFEMSAEARQDIKLQQEIQQDQGTLSQLGCAVLSVFAKSDGMKNKDEILERIPALVSALQQQYNANCFMSNFRNSLEASSDILETLQSLATVPTGADLILSPPCTTSFLKIINSTTNQPHDIIKLLNVALVNSSPTVSFSIILEPLAKLFSTTKSSELATDLLSLFILQLERTPPAESIRHPLQQGLKHLLLSKLEEATRTQSLILLSILLNHFGPSVLFQPCSSEPQAKEWALLTIRLASIGLQIGISLSAPVAEKRRHIAEMEILHAATIWLVSSPEDGVAIGSQKLTAEEILTIRESISAAIHEASIFLRTAFDEYRTRELESSIYGNVDETVKTAVKLVGGWLAEGGGDQDDESLGLLEVFLALCSTDDAELTTWAMRGIEGVVLYTDTGGDELMTSRDKFSKFLDLVVDKLSSKKPSRGELVMAREICIVFKLLVEGQPLILTQPAVTNFPRTVYDSFSMDDGENDETCWAARTEASLLALEILYSMAKQEGDHPPRSLREMIRVWCGRAKRLERFQKEEEAKGSINDLASALEDIL